VQAHILPKTRGRLVAQDAVAAVEGGASPSLDSRRENALQVEDLVGAAGIELEPFWGVSIAGAHRRNPEPREGLQIW
jgi:hypothetical protein